MTEPDEATMPDRPEKAHGDALDEAVDSGGADTAEQEAADQQS